MDSHTTGRGLRLGGYGTISTERLTDYHNNNIIKLSWCVGKVGEGFPRQTLPKTLKWVVMYSSLTFNINGIKAHRQTGPVSVLVYYEAM